MHLFVPLLAVRDPEDITSHCTAWLSGRRLFFGAAREHCCFSAPDKNHMLEPDGLESCADWFSPPSLGGWRGRLSRGSSENVQSQSGSCLATETPSGAGGRDCWDAPKVSRVFAYSFSLLLKTV